jgi:hypothetical protein
MSSIGTKLPFRDVRHPVATGGKPDIAQKVGFGSDRPIWDIYPTSLSDVLVQLTGTDSIDWALEERI